MSSGPVQTVGREIELERVEAALEALAHGPSGCLAVEGEPGIGKPPFSPS